METHRNGNCGANTRIILARLSTLHLPGVNNYSNLHTSLYWLNKLYTKNNNKNNNNNSQKIPQENLRRGYF